MYVCMCIYKYRCKAIRSILKSLSVFGPDCLRREDNQTEGRAAVLPERQPQSLADTVSFLSKPCRGDLRFDVLGALLDKARCRSQGRM